MAQDSRDGAPGHHSLRSPQEHQGRLPLLATGGTGRRRREKSKSKPPKVWQTQWEKPKKGGKGSWSPKGKGGKGKSRNTSSTPWPDHWAFKNPKGVAYCRDHHLHNKYSGSCGRSHNCPCPPSEACATGMPTPQEATQGPRGSQATSARAHTAGESQSHQSHSGRQTELGRPGRAQVGGDLSRVPPAPEAEEREWIQPGHSKKTEAPFSPAPTEAVEEPPDRPRGGDPPSKGRQAQGQTTSASDKGHTETPERTSPTFPWMQDTPERLRSRLRWMPRPVPESSKPTLILLYAGKDDAGALDAYLHAYNPAFIWAVDIRRKGGDLGHDMLGDEPYSTMCSMAMAGKVAFVGGGPNCRTWSILRWFPKPGRSRHCGAWRPGKGGHGQRQRAHAPTDVPDLAGLPGQRTVPQVGSSSLMDPMECSKGLSAARCSSIWVTRAYIQWANALHLLRRCWMGYKLFIGYMRQLRRDLPLRVPPAREGGKPPPEGWQWPEPGTRWVLLKADVTKAHRRVKVLSRWPHWDGG